VEEREEKVREESGVNVREARERERAREERIGSLYMIEIMIERRRSSRIRVMRE